MLQHRDDVRICMCLSMIDVRTRQAEHKRAPRRVLLHVQHLHERWSMWECEQTSCGSEVIPTHRNKSLQVPTRLWLYLIKPYTFCTLQKRQKSKRGQEVPTYRSPPIVNRARASVCTPQPTDSKEKHYGRAHQQHVTHTLPRSNSIPSPLHKHECNGTCGHRPQIPTPTATTSTGMKVRCTRAI